MLDKKSQRKALSNMIEFVTTVFWFFFLKAMRSPKIKAMQARR